MKPWTAKEEKFGKFFIKRIGKWQTSVYEMSGGRLWNKFLGVPCAILTTTGAKTGQQRKTPLLYLEHENTVVMVASTGGFSKDPFWYKNLLKTPEVFVQIGNNKRKMQARTASAEERDILWPKLDEIYDGYKEYRARTEGIREIQIVIFEAA